MDLEFPTNYHYYKNSYKLHYAPLMMSQKEPPRNHPWVLPGCFLEKYLTWFEFLFYLLGLVEYDECFLGASYYVLAAAEESTQEAPIIIFL